jgi:PadR family transcriptional regulator PadR
MDRKTSEVLQGTLDLMILKTLHALGPLHGFGIARRLEQVSRDVLQLNEGTVYTALLRLQQQGWITAEWGTPRTTARRSSIPSAGAAGSSSRWKRKTGSAFPP